MPTQATIAITPGAGQLLDAVSLVIGPQTVVRETMVIADPSNATQLATVSAGGALLVDASATIQPISGTIAATQSGTWNIGSIASLPAVTIAASQTIAVTNIGTFAVQATLSSGSAVIGHVIVDSGTVAATQSGTWDIGSVTTLPAITIAAAQTIAVTNTGTFAVQATLSAETTKVIGTIRILGNLGVALDAVLGATKPANVLQVGGNDGTNAYALPLASGGGKLLVTADAITIAAAQTIAVTNTGTFAVQATLSAETTKVIGTVNLSASQKIEVYDGTNTATVKAASTAATATDTALVVTTNGSTTAGACANTSVTSTTSSILSTNAARRECVIVNTDVVAVYLGLGQTPTATAYHVVLKPCTVAHDGTGGSFVSDTWKGAINAITASTSGHVAVTELT